MNPVVKRILVNGGATAVILGVIGFAFTEMAGMWTPAPARPGSAGTNPPVSESLRYRVPLMMAFWGFVFVAVTEVVLSRVRKPAPPKPADTTQDDAEKLLNELLAQAESKMALEAESQKAEAQQTEDQVPDGPKSEDRRQETEKQPDKAQATPSPG